MNLLETLKKNPSKAEIKQMVRFIGNNQVRFARLVAIFSGGPYRITQHASGPLNACVEADPKLLLPHLKKLLKDVSLPAAGNAIKRNTLRLLQFVVIPPAHQGVAMRICFELLANKKEAIAVRVFSMTVLANLALRHPAIKRELILIIEDMLPYGSAGIVSRGKKIVKLLK